MILKSLIKPEETMLIHETIRLYTHLASFPLERHLRDRISRNNALSQSQSQPQGCPTWREITTLL